MNYIVFDLEWNHPRTESKNDNKIKKLPFEIIEIGAVKLDSNRDIISSFSEMIKPQVYTEINEIIHDIVKLDTKDFVAKDSFKEVIERFINWCGEEYIFCTWGSMDLTELQRNMEYFKICNNLSGPINYYDVQKLFSMEFLGHREMQALENVIDYFNLEKNKSFHRAYTDAKYTAEIFKKLDIEFVEKYYSIDAYHNPKTKEETVLVNYETYSKYISEEFFTKEDIMADKDIKEVLCYKCNKPAHISVEWFCSNPKMYCCIARCEEHGLLIGKVRIKKKDNGMMYAIKTIKSTDEDGYKEIHDRQMIIRAKRKAKRIKKRK